MLGCIAAAPASASAHLVWSTPTAVSGSDSALDAQLGLDVGPGDVQTVTYDDPQLNCARSGAASMATGGGAWSSPADVPLPMGGCDGWSFNAGSIGLTPIAGPGGKAAALWVTGGGNAIYGAQSNNEGHLFVSLRNPNGTWAPKEEVSTPSPGGGGQPTQFIDHAHGFLDAAGNLVVVWRSQLVHSGQADDERVGVYARTRSSAGTWGAVQTLYQSPLDGNGCPTNWVGPIDIASGTDGKVMAAWSVYAHDPSTCGTGTVPGASVRMSQLTSTGGSSWSSAVTVDSSSAGPLPNYINWFQADSDDAGDLTLAWMGSGADFVDPDHHVVTATRLAGQSTFTDQPVGFDFGMDPANGPQLRVAANGAAIIGYGNGGTSGAVTRASATAAFGSAQPVVNTPSGGERYAEFAAGPADDFAAAWVDSACAACSVQHAAITTARLAPGATNWSAPVDVPVVLDRYDELHMVEGPDGSYTLAWRYDDGVYFHMYTSRAVQGADVLVDEDGSGEGTITSADGKIDCGNTCDQGYPNGTTVTLTANPVDGASFDGWSGGGCSGTSTCVLNVATTDMTVTATFTAATTPTSNPDTDGDGIPDLQDACPNQPGPASNFGCPEDGSGPTTDPAACNAAETKLDKAKAALKKAKKTHKKEKIKKAKEKLANAKDAVAAACG